MKRNRALDFLVYLAVRLLVCVVQALSIESCQTLSGWLATLASRVLGIRRQVVDDNLKHAFPGLSADARRQLAWEMWEHLFLLVTEIAHAPRKIHDTNWREFITLSTPTNLVRAMFDDRPLILVSGHYGNFELSGYVLGLFGYSSFTIARPLDNAYLDRFLNQFRGAKGQHILPKNGSAQRIDALLESGGTLALLADQHAGPKGFWVDFFGRPASTHKAIALFSLSNGAPMIFSYTRRIGKPLHHLIATDALVDPATADPALLSMPALTRWYTQHLEATIREVPQQYWWVHKRWKDAPAKRLAASRAAA